MSPARHALHPRHYGERIDEHFGGNEQVSFGEKSDWIGEKFIVIDTGRGIENFSNWR